MNKTIKIEKHRVTRFTIRQDEDKFMAERMVERGLANYNADGDYVWWFKATDQNDFWYGEGATEKAALLTLAEVMFG